MIKLSQEVSNSDAKLEKTNIVTNMKLINIEQQQSTKTNVKLGIKKNKGPGLLGC